MINYTESISLLMEDIVSRVPALSFIDMSKVLIFARGGRTRSDGAFATCHAIGLPPSEPGYYFWKDRETGQLTRRSEWFATTSPTVTVGTQSIDFMVSFALPRFCDQAMSLSRKSAYYAGEPDWMAKLDTIVHELYHIDPARPGIRRMERGDGTYSANSHGHRFFEDVVGMVKQYLATGPDPKTYEFLQYGFEELTARFGGVVGTAFGSYPSYPRRYADVLNPQPAAPDGMDGCAVEPLKTPRLGTRFTQDDLVVRQFLPTTSRALVRKRRSRAA